MPFLRPPSSEVLEDVIEENQKEALEEIDADRVDRSVRILPGIRDMIDFLPDGHCAVPISAKTHGVLTVFYVSISDVDVVFFQL